MTKLKLINGGLLAVALLSFLLTACGQTTRIEPAIETESPDQTVKETSSDFPTLPLGSYSTMLKAKDFNPEYIEAVPTLRNYLGLWELKLADQNHFSLDLNNQEMVEGVYQLTTDQIYFDNNSKWPSLCTDNQEEDSTEAIYRWRLEDQELELMGTDAECSVKDLVFSQLLQLSD